ncbi:MAG TPA: hypothetical protein VLQ90_05640, partial [Pyrinomonadaceae bacterium]|nr:hypothetical protein [Pyrinomonadaceae bacterium]
MPSEKSKNKRLRIVPGAAAGSAPAPDERPETEVTASVQDPDCPHCFGTGMEVVPEIGARRCRCQTLDQRQRLFRSAHIPPRYQHCTLQDYKAADSETSKWIAKAEAQRILDDYLVIDGRGLVFICAVGVGKTHLAVAIL